MSKPAIIEVTFDKIRNFVDNPDAPELTGSEKTILERLDFAYDQLKYNTTVAVVNRLMRKYEIKRSQAYIDIRNCKRIFNPIHRRDTEWLRNFIVEDAVKQLNIAQKNRNHKAWQLARKDLITIYGIDKKDDEAIDPTLLGHNNYFININVGDNERKKIDYDMLHKLPVNKRHKLTDFLYPELESEVEAEKIMNS